MVFVVVVEAVPACMCRVFGAFESFNATFNNLCIRGIYASADGGKVALCSNRYAKNERNR